MATITGEERGWLLAEVSGAVANALRAGAPAEDIAGAVAVELGDTSKAKVRVADALRREGYLRALARIEADIERFGNCVVTQGTLARVFRSARAQAPGEAG